MGRHQGGRRHHTPVASSRAGGHQLACGRRTCCLTSRSVLHRRPKTLRGSAVAGRVGQPACTAAIALTTGHSWSAEHSSTTAALEARSRRVQQGTRHRSSCREGSATPGASAPFDHAIYQAFNSRRSLQPQGRHPQPAARPCSYVAALNPHGACRHGQMGPVNAAGSPVGRSQ